MLLEPSSHFGKHVGQRVSRQSVNVSADTSARLHLYSLNLLSWSLTFSNFFLLPTERRNKIRVRQGKFFDECIGSVSADVSVVCRPTRWLTCLPTCRWDRILYLYRIVIHQGPVVQRLDNTIHWINRYPVDKCWQNKPRYLLDSDSSGPGCSKAG